jgi:hypothetical protein
MWSYRQTAYTLSHIRMTEEQYQRYKDMPVISM